MTEIDTEISNQLFDPRKNKSKSSSSYIEFVKAHRDWTLPGGRLDLKRIAKAWREQRGTSKRSRALDLRIKLSKAKAQRLARHLKKEHPSTRGKMQVFDIKGIKAWLRSQGVEPDTIDVDAEYDHNLSHAENLKRFKAMLGMRKRKSYGSYEKMKSEFYRGTGKLLHASPEERAAAFARMRETGTLRGYDTPQQRTEKEWKAKAQLGKKHRGQMTLTGGASGSKRLSEFVFDPQKKHGLNRPPKRWFYAMRDSIAKSSDVKNPSAIVGNIWKKLSPKKRAEIKARELSGERFKYDLPVPDDRVTHGTGTLRMVKPFNLAEVQVNLSLKDYLAALRSGLFSKMKREDGTIALVARCKSAIKNCNIFVDKV